MTETIINDANGSFLNSLLNNIDIDINIDNNSVELWQRRHIGMHTYIPSIIITIWALYKWFFLN